MRPVQGTISGPGRALLAVMLGLASGCDPLTLEPDDPIRGDAAIVLDSGPPGSADGGAPGDGGVPRDGAPPDVDAGRPRRDGGSPGCSPPLIEPPSCPAECTGGCAGGVCTIACDRTASCQQAELRCPEDMACVVRCAGVASCQVSRIHCSSDYPCEVRCSNTSSCQESVLDCGEGACRSVCTGVLAQLGRVSCGPSCDCAPSCP